MLERHREDAKSKQIIRRIWKWKIVKATATWIPFRAS